MLSVAFFGYHSHRRMPPWGCRDGKGVTALKGTGTQWYHNKLIFRAYIEKVLRCTCNVLVKSEYIEQEYEYMTHKLYVYEYLKNVLEYRVLLPQVWLMDHFFFNLCSKW